MAAAARAGDMTSHGKPLDPMGGSSNVWIGGKHAWRALSDFHQCPLSTGNVPHVGGMVLQGSTKVFINNLPAARQGDAITGPTEVGNSIKGGFPKVQIGG
jgi:uncharacterized Zn-binding protein involved in type VI secretion